VFRSAARATRDTLSDDPNGLRLPEFVADAHGFADRVAEGLAAASHVMGLECRRLDLVRGLQTAVADVGYAERAWPSGTDVFGEAVNTEVFIGPDDLEEGRARVLLWRQLDP
jgi:hypothetical protein